MRLLGRYQISLRIVVVSRFFAPVDVPVPVLVVPTRFRRIRSLPRALLWCPNPSTRILTIWIPCAAPDPGPHERLLTVREVASRLGVSTALVYKLCERNKLRSLRIGGPSGSKKTRSRRSLLDRAMRS